MNGWLSVAGKAGIRIFICYRRHHDEFGVAYIRRRLLTEFGEDAVFIDVHGIALGEDFRVVLTEAVTSCDVLLVIMTEAWLTLQHEDGRRKLDTDDDFVRIEIETALQCGIQVLPLLLGKATMPQPSALPASIRQLAYQHAISVRGGIDADTDLDRLATQLKKIEAALEAVRKERNILIDSVERGDWLLAAQMRGSAVIRKEWQASAQYRALEALRAQIEHLRNAVVALELPDLRAAYDALSKVSDDAPPIIAIARRFVALGVRLSDALTDTTLIRELARELRELVEQSPGTKVPGERQVTDMVQRSLRDADYQEAVRLYDAGSFSDASRLFDEVDYRDAKERLLRCAAWLSIVDAIRALKWEDARRRLQSFLGRWEEPRARDVLKWCIFAGRIVPSLQLLAAGGAAVEERVLWDGGPSPYKVFHLAPAATMDEANDISYVLQEQPGGMTDLQRASWDALRLVDRRLVADFSLYAVRDPNRARDALQRHFVFDAAEPPESVLVHIQEAMRQSGLDAIVAELGEDAGILYALTRNYDAAIERFTELARRAPWDARALHHLGLAAYAKVHLNPDSYEVSDAWETVAVAWGAVFADTRFWRSWWSQRRRVYPIPDEDLISGARSKLRGHLLEELKSAADRDVGVADVFRIELNAARATGALNGIPIDAGPQHRAVVGPRGVALLGLEKALAEWIATFAPQDLARASEQRDVCVAFSAIAPAQLLFDEAFFEDAIATLEAEDGAIDFAARHPGFASISGDRGRTLFESVRRSLLRQAHMKAALAAVSEVPVDIEGALGHWNKALTLASPKDREPLCAEIRDVIVGRCHVLQEQEREGRDRLESLNDAVKLAQEATLQNWDNRDGLLRQTLVDALLERATHVSNAFDMEKEAREDALRACGLAPESLRAILVLCVTSLHYARELHQHGKSDVADALVREVKERLTDAGKLFPGNSDLEKTVHVMEEMAAVLAGSTQSLERCMEALGRIARETEPSDSRLAQAMVLEAQSDFPRAVELYWQLAQSKPGGESIGRLSWCYRMWLLHLRENGDADNYQRVARDANARCPNAAALSDFVDALPREAP